MGNMWLKQSYRIHGWYIYPLTVNVGKYAIHGFYMGMYGTWLKTITPSRACGMAGCSKLRSISTSDLTKSDGAGTLSLQTCLAQGRKFAAKKIGSPNFRSKWIEMTRNDVCIPILAMQLDYWAFTANIHKCSQTQKS